MRFNLPEDFLLTLLILSNTFTKCSKYVLVLNKYVYVLALSSDRGVWGENQRHRQSVCSFQLPRNPKPRIKPHPGKEPLLC